MTSRLVVYRDLLARVDSLRGLDTLQVTVIAPKYRVLVLDPFPLHRISVLVRDHVAGYVCKRICHSQTKRIDLPSRTKTVVPDFSISAVRRPCLSISRRCQADPCKAANNPLSPYSNPLKPGYSNILKHCIAQTPLPPSLLRRLPPLRRGQLARPVCSGRV